jgi:transcription termination factor Rho
MSVDSTALERATLERKDRDELVAIAQALGGKVASRAKKADIVNTILELTGVSTATDSPAPAPAPAARSRKPAAAPVEEPAPVEQPDVDDVEADEPQADEVEADDEADDEVDDAEDDDDAPQAARPAPARPGGGERRPQQQPQRGNDRQDQGGRNGEQGRQGGGTNPNGNPNNNPNNNNPNQQNERTNGEGDGEGDDEGGNRRRRRRGRNRGEGQGGDEPLGDPVEVSGIVDLREEGYGFLRLHGFLPSRDDAYISVKQARQFGLRRGDIVTGASRPALRNEKNPALLRIDTINAAEPDQSRDRRKFEDLTPLFPDERIKLETTASAATGDMTARIIDLLAPIGKGQRGLIVSPPKAGKTSVMKQIARSIEANHPEVTLFVVLVDERPEEVTDMRRWLKSETSTVVASTFDRPTEEHVQVAELVTERAKRLVEAGQDVVIILDGITRLARAYNLAAPATGRVMSGGIDTGALYPPKKIFGAARNIEEGGSLTILATALVETGSKMDEVIFEEFKGTGNMELRLDRRLAERRIYPAIDVDASSTRHEELLFLGTQLQQVWKLRRVLQAMEGGAGAGLELLNDRMKTFKTNQEFLAEIAKGPSGS